MSYIINNSTFVSLKLTDKGREGISKGNINFSYWSLGDSEINYDRESIRESNLSDISLSGTSNIIRPKDRNNELVYRLLENETDNGFKDLTNANISSLKVVVNNQAKTRGFFSGNTISGFTTLTGSPYTVESSLLNNNQLSGGTTLTIGTGSTLNVGDLLLISMTNDVVGNIPVNSNDTPLPYYWYKIQSYSGGTVTLDRSLPNQPTTSSTLFSQYYIYRGGNVYDGIASGNTTSYWDTNTLAFNATCDISCSDVPVWNQNNIFCENLLGFSGSTNEDYTKYGSYTYLGTKYPFMDYSCDNSSIDSTISCDGFSMIDNVKKNIAVLHYTNNTVSNFYGEFFFLDDSQSKILSLDMPNMMYHRRFFQSGSTFGDVMGMRFISSGSVKTINGIDYVDLIEDPSLIDSLATPRVVGKVFINLKMVVIDDEEIVMAMSYKSNRNWTLPNLTASVSNNVNNDGVLDENKVMYVTYRLSNDSLTGLTKTIHNQNYLKVINNTSTSKDVEFKFENVGYLPYMRKKESITYDGLGFYADKFEVLYQIVDNTSDRPQSDQWLVYDYTSTGITNGISGETIDPLLIENQNPNVNSFKIDKNIFSGSTTYNLSDDISLPTNLQPNVLQFGDERFFYGNIDTFIGATIYKTLFKFDINPTEINSTTNPTKENQNTNFRISEIGIYDDKYNLIMVGKLSIPFEINNNIIQMNLSIDF